ncbi:hypothetical protein [Streptomyces sp. NPDC056480]|uniref:hypothetical protein n=1 Tax=Streptomyces sp. NPDC056480 TaxID=3345833 RepID=UPI0036A1304D
MSIDDTAGVYPEPTLRATQAKALTAEWIDYSLQGSVMTSMGSGSKKRADLPPGREALASLITSLYQNLAVASLTQAAELLASRNWRKSPSEISRYRSGGRKPPLGFVEQLHALAVERAGAQAVGHALAQVRRIHAAAEPTLCRACSPLREENERLRSENSRLIASQKSGASRTPFADRTVEEVTPLPVPQTSGDRQRSARDIAAARQLASTAADLHGSGQTSHAVTWLHDVSASLTPLESAASIALLRQKEGQLADTAIGIHGRTRPERDVILIALELYEFGLADDAGALLKAAAE